MLRALVALHPSSQAIEQLGLVGQWKAGLALPRALRDAAAVAASSGLLMVAEPWRRRSVSETTLFRERLGGKLCSPSRNYTLQQMHPCNYCGHCQWQSTSSGEI